MHLQHISETTDATPPLGPTTAPVAVQALPPRMKCEVYGGLLTAAGTGNRKQKKEAHMCKQAICGQSLCGGGLSGRSNYFLREQLHRCLEKVTLAR